VSLFGQNFCHCLTKPWSESGSGLDPDPGTLLGSNPDWPDLGQSLFSKWNFFGSKKHFSVFLNHYKGYSGSGGIPSSSYLDPRKRRHEKQLKAPENVGQKHWEPFDLINFDDNFQPIFWNMRLRSIRLQNYGRGTGTRSLAIEMKLNKWRKIPSIYLYVMIPNLRVMK
jgi:hypothetical protein